jgi:hypothetical protein
MPSSNALVARQVMIGEIGLRKEGQFKRTSRTCHEDLDRCFNESFGGTAEYHGLPAKMAIINEGSGAVGVLVIRDAAEWPPRVPIAHQHGAQDNVNISLTRYCLFRCL